MRSYNALQDYLLRSDSTAGLAPLKQPTDAGRPTSEPEELPDMESDESWSLSCEHELQTQ